LSPHLRHCLQSALAHALTRSHSHQASDTPHVPHTSSRIPPRPWYVRSTTTISLYPRPPTQDTHVEAELVPVLAVLAVNHGDAGARVGRDLGDVGGVVDGRAGRGGHEEREGEREDEGELHRVVLVVVGGFRGLWCGAKGCRKSISKGCRVIGRRLETKGERRSV
jgi:hypothetical protein